MSGLLFLSQEDFHVTNGKKGAVLSTNLKGFSLVLFYSTRCNYCKELVPIFKNLPGTTGGCQFGMINVSTNKDIVAISKQTITPLTYVPYIVLYVSGTPFMAYQGPSNEDDIRNFVIEVAHKLQKKQQFTSETEEKIVKNPKRHIPEYSIGIPKTSDIGVCYLTDIESWK